jgi:DNA-binding response OmpR family regulator
MSTGARVLIVEDEWLLAEHYVTILRDAGYTIIGPAPSVDEALKLISQSAIDAALLDINLRGTMSYSLAEHLAARQVAFAFITGYDPVDLPPHLAQKMLLRKPAQPEALIGVVESLVKRSVGSGQNSA